MTWSGLTDFQHSEWERCGRRKGKAHHPLRSARPLHRESVLTILSMSFFHSMPSDVTRYHSLHTSSAAHSDLASKYDRMFSAIWSRPRALVRGEGSTEKEQRGYWAIFHRKPFKRTAHAVWGRHATVPSVGQFLSQVETWVKWVSIIFP